MAYHIATISNLEGLLFCPLPSFDGRLDWSGIHNALRFYGHWREVFFFSLYIFGLGSQEAHWGEGITWNGLGGIKKGGLFCCYVACCIWKTNEKERHNESY